MNFIDDDDPQKIFLWGNIELIKISPKPPSFIYINLDYYKLRLKG